MRPIRAHCRGQSRRRRADGLGLGGRRAGGRTARERGAERRYPGVGARLRRHHHGREPDRRVESRRRADVRLPARDGARPAAGRVNHPARVPRAAPRRARALSGDGRRSGAGQAHRAGGAARRRLAAPGRTRDHGRACREQDAFHGLPARYHRAQTGSIRVAGVQRGDPALRLYRQPRSARAAGQHHGLHQRARGRRRRAWSKRLREQRDRGAGRGKAARARWRGHSRGDRLHPRLDRQDGRADQRHPEAVARGAAAR